VGERGRERVCFHLNGVESPVNLLRGRGGLDREGERASRRKRERVCLCCSMLQCVAVCCSVL